MMKKIFNLIAIVAGVALITACQEKDNPTPTPDPGPDGRRVVNSGKSAVTVTTVADGYDLSYDSWLVIRTTKDGLAKDETVSVNITTKVRTPKQEAILDSWLVLEGLEWTSSQTSSEKGLTPKGAIQLKEVTTSYKSESQIGSVAYELKAVIPSYDDGEIKHDMPCYKFEGLTDLGTETKIEKSFERDGKAYAYRTLNHSLSVKFGNKLTLTGKLDCLRPISNEGGKYLVSSEIVMNGSKQETPRTMLLNVVTKDIWSNGQETFTMHNGEAYLWDPSGYTETVIKTKSLDDLKFEIKSCTLKSSEEYHKKDEDTCPFECREAFKDTIAIDLGYFVVDVPLYRKNFILDNGVLQQRLTDFRYDLSSAHIYDQSIHKGESSLLIEIAFGELRVDMDVWFDVAIED